MRIYKCKKTQLWIATSRHGYNQYTATGFCLAGAMISLARLIMELKK